MAASSRMRIQLFNITAVEKADNEKYIISLLKKCAALLDDYRKNPSNFDLHDASIAVQDAMFMANDPDACESPPLASCHLHLGHVLRAMKKYLEAQNAYLAASKQRVHNSIDRTASEQAAEYAAMMDREVWEGKRRGGVWWSETPGENPPRISHVQAPYECRDERLKTTGLDYTCPTVQQVRAGRAARIVRPQLRNNLTRPQVLVKCDGGWISEAMSTPGFDDSTPQSIRLVSSPSSHQFKDPW